MESLALFGRKVRSIREAGGKTRELIAESAAITPNYLGEIERGEKWPSLEVITALGDSLEVSPATFFEFEDQEVDARILKTRVNQLLDNSDVKQLQQALRLLKALLKS